VCLHSTIHMQFPPWECDHRGRVDSLHRTFTADWVLAEKAAESADERPPAAKIVKKVAKLIAKELPLVAPVLNGAVKKSSETPPM
jgi:hypothetical protein